MTRMKGAVAALGMLAAASVHASASTWPASHPAHAGYFCAADGGELTDDTPPRGYGEQLAKQLRAYERRGVDAAQALAAIRQRAGCDRIARRTGWVRVDAPTLRLLGWSSD